MATQLSEKNKAIFERAVMTHAVKLNMDPLVIEKAYEGRGMMLVLREEEKDGYAGGAAMAGVATAFVGMGTVISILEESGTYGDNGPMNNIGIGGVVALLPLLALGACFWKRKSITNAVKADVERFTANPQPLLPKPESPKLI
jgi:hypothetical protein